METRCRRITLSPALWAAVTLLCGICGHQCCPRAAADPAAPLVGSSAWSPCPHCDLMVGAGTTFWPWHWTDGVVAPVALEIDDSRWELGAFRFSTSQYLKSSRYPPSTLSAHPYWGFSAMRRWQVLHRSRCRLYLGFGASYKTETDLLDATRWNFAYLFAIRYTLAKSVFIELGLRHWSNAWIKEPNRGQNLVAISFGLR